MFGLILRLSQLCSFSLYFADRALWRRPACRIASTYFHHNDLHCGCQLFLQEFFEIYLMLHILLPNQ